jgi:hypothetical protein
MTDLPLFFTVIAPVGAAALVGGTGYLFGWTVTMDGRDVCDAPFFWTATREIECD